MRKGIERHFTVSGVPVFDEGGAFHNLAAIELTSGARHAGNISAREPDDDHVRWITSFMDELSIPLGEVRSVILLPGTPASEAAGAGTGSGITWGASAPSR